MKQVMHIETLSVGSMRANCYLVADHLTKECFIIDPGDDTDFITSKISQLQFIPKAIIATHGHFDHIMSAGELLLIYDVPFWMHENDFFLIERMEETAEHFLGYKIEAKKPHHIDFLKDQQKISLSNNQFTIIHTPGHTPGSVSLYNSDSSVLFTGDTLFSHGSVGRTDFSYSSSQDLERSLAKLLVFSNETVIYPGHNESSILGEAKGFFSL